MDEERLQMMNAVTSPTKLQNKFNKDDLVKYIVHLRQELEAAESLRLISKRVEFLERCHVISSQYNRRENIELVGIPESLSGKNLEDKCVEVLEEITKTKIPDWKIHACHRLKNKKTVIMRFVTRKVADLAIHKRKELKTLDKRKLGFDPETKIFLNESLCPPLRFLHFKVRKALKEEKINSFNLWKGKLTIKFMVNDTPIPVTHINDLLQYELASEDDINEFFKYF